MVTMQDAIAGERRLNSPVAFASGAVFVILGISGFLTGGSHHPVGAGGAELLGVLPIHLVRNGLHLGAGAALIAAGILGARQARVANTVVGVGSLLLCLVGLAVVGTTANLLALNGADNAIHLLFGLALTVVGLGGSRPPR